MKTLPYLFLAFSLLLVSCSKDSPTGPSTTAPTTPTVTAIIGASGGNISYEGFSMSVPAAAFARTETLRVEKQTYEGEFGSMNVTDQFRLDGLPADFAGKIDIKLKCTRAPSTGLFIGVGAEGTDLESGKSRILYKPIPAISDSGYLKVSLDQTSLGRFLAKTNGAHGSGGVDISFWTGFDQLDTLKSSAEHFKVIHPRSSVGMAMQIARELEEAYLWFTQLGFNRGTYSAAKWPMWVQIGRASHFENNDLVGIEMRWSALPSPGVPEIWLGCNENEWDHGIAEFRKWLFANFSAVFCTVHDNFFHQEVTPERLVTHGQRLWPYTALSAWAGAKAHVPGQDSLPPMFKGRMLTPLFGVPCPSNVFPGGHGRGMVGLMKHFADVYGESKLVDLYHAVRDPSATNAVDLLFNSIPDPENIWWPEFVKRYLAGEIYGVPADTFLADLQGGTGPREFTISGKNDTLKYFSAQYRDLSAKLYRVNLRYPGIASNAMISFEVGPPTLNLNYVHVIVFGLKNHELQYWGKANKVSVAKLTDLTAEGYDIVAAVVNSANERPYTGSMAIDLDVTVQTQSFHLASIQVRTTGTTQWYDGSTTSGSFVLYNSSKRFREGTYTDGHFTSSWNDVTTVTNSGSWDIVVDNSQGFPLLKYFKATESTISGTETETWKIEASATCAIPGANHLGGLEFIVRGLDVANHIKPVENRLDNSATNYWRQLTATDFDSDSYIKIIIE